jgi:hypothetical protein
MNTTPLVPFFDYYPLFYNSSKTSASSDRLSARHAAIIKEHRELFAELIKG